MMRSPITTHVLDTTLGKPAVGVPVKLEIQEDGQWRDLAKGLTDKDGRIGNLLPTDERPEKGIYRMTFGTSTYFRNIDVDGFYPYVRIIFEISQPHEHHHIPLLLSPYGYSTYRGS